MKSGTAQILLVEDDPMIADMLAGFFESTNLSLVHAANSGEALQRVSISSPIVLRLDGTNAVEGRALLGESAYLSTALAYGSVSLAELGRFEEGVACGEEALRLAEQLQLPPELIAKFVGLGISSVEALEGATVEDFKESGIPAEEVEAVGLLHAGE